MIAGSSPGPDVRPIGTAAANGLAIGAELVPEACKRIAMRRVVVTGLGMVTPLPAASRRRGRASSRARAARARSKSSRSPTSPAKIACQIPRGDGSDGTYNPDQWMEPKEQRKVDEFIVYAMCAATQAIDDSGWKPESYDDQHAHRRDDRLRASAAWRASPRPRIVLKEKGPRRVSPFFIPGRLINLASGYVSIAHGLKGPNHAVVTACSTGAHAIGDAARLIALGDADVMVAGGTESPICRISIAGLRRLPRALDRLQRRADARPRGPTTRTATAS